MAKNLIIVESPAKTRTLKKFLGRSYAVEASLGHIRDLAKKNLGLGERYEPHYVVLPEKREAVKKLRAAAGKAEVVFLAPDPDREGEAIAWHIAEVLGPIDAQLRRVTFNEITKSAVLRALATPGAIDQRKVDAQQARRILDRLMGFRLSPLLWDKVKQGLSAGRVQSVALKMVCDRQNEIDAFVAEEYWILGARLEGQLPPPFTAQLYSVDGKKTTVGSGEKADEIEKAVLAGEFRVAEIERKESKQRPGPPFITSRLQQEAARRFGFSVKRTMALAQGLYEGREIGDQGPVGLITYMRTDSTRVAHEALEAVREFIARTYGHEALPERPNLYRSKKNSQDAHEAIRPTTFDLPPDAVAPFLKPDELKLYRLIWERFVASQMLPALFDATRVDAANGRTVFRASGRVLKSPGFLAVYREAPEEPEAEGKEGDRLPPLEVGERLRLLGFEKQQKFTQPPAQYSEATLVKALEESGIGRPSTYAQILATLSEREYAEKIEGRFRPSILGRLVNQLLQGSFGDVLNEGYTAELEEELDRIEEGSLPWRAAIERFDSKFSKDLERAAEQMPSVKRDGVPTVETCPQCGAPLVLRFGRYGAFYACSTYPECSYTRNPEPENEVAAPAEDAQTAPCEKCGKPMATRRSRFGTFLGCSGYPECRNIRKTGSAAAPAKPTGVRCPKCGEGAIEEKRSRRGKAFFSCGRYPQCDYALWNRPVPEPCPQCGAAFLTEKTTKRKGTERVCVSEGCGYSEASAGA